MDSSLWDALPPDLTLPLDEVHVWRGSLVQPAAFVESLATTLSPDERARAAAFYFERDRQRFLVGRGLLRALLSAYLGIPARRIAFTYGPRGKPALSEACGCDLTFNVSHSHDLALYAITRARRIGVDIERIRELDVEGVAARFFSPAEIAALRALPAQERPAAFFRCWTRKEAFVKARGDGLALPLNQFDVSLTPGAARLSSIRWDTEEAARWHLEELSVGGHYVAALAVEGPACTLCKASLPSFSL
ncbi:MAG TPA: 4'-phosphopantetheinyl transferase superfamily protein [Chthonomonadaceae bacterium]|nr:4'-phosphopantetheinyl transferase superfamily protein [Chthonomonadaceae bacterium]